MLLIVEYSRAPPHGMASTAANSFCAIRYGLLDQWLGQQVEVFQPAGQFGPQERVALQQVLKTPAGRGRHQPDGVIGGQRTA